MAGNDLKHLNKKNPLKCESVKGIGGIVIVIVLVCGVKAGCQISYEVLHLLVSLYVSILKCHHEL